MITFNHSSNRDFFQTLLDWSPMKEDDSCTRSVLSRSMHTCTLEHEPVEDGMAAASWAFQR